MNKLNLLLLISLVAFASGCKKIELPDPKEEEPVFGFWSGKIGESSMVMNNDSMYMTTKIVPDPILKVNTFETTFNMLGTNEPRWILKFRDSKSMRTTADTSDLFYKSESRYLKASQLSLTGDVVTHSLKDITLGHDVSWTSSNGVLGVVNGGRHFSVENAPTDFINTVKASIVHQGKIHSIEKRYVPTKGDINIQAIKINGKNITIEVENPSQFQYLTFKWGQASSANNTTSIESTGPYKIEISDTSIQCHIIIELHIELINNVIQPIKLPLFTSNHSIKYATLPNFSKMEIIYFDEDGTEYSSRYVDQVKPFIINDIETFNKTNSQGQKVKKLDIEFSVMLKTADGSKSIEFTAVKGDIGFAYE